MKQKSFANLKLSLSETNYICWNEAYYLDNVRHDKKRAAKYAWKQATIKFPRLKEYKFPY